MKIDRINSGNDKKYPYQYRIDLREETPDKCAAIINWANHATEFKGTVAGLSIYLRNELDLTMFVMKWS